MSFPLVEQALADASNILWTVEVPEHLSESRRRRFMIDVLALDAKIDEALRLVQAYQREKE